MVKSRPVQPESLCDHCDAAEQEAASQNLRYYLAAKRRERGSQRLHRFDQESVPPEPVVYGGRVRRRRLILAKCHMAARALSHLRNVGRSVKKQYAAGEATPHNQRLNRGLLSSRETATVDDDRIGRAKAGTEQLGKRGFRRSADDKLRRVPESTLQFEYVLRSSGEKEDRRESPVPQSVAGAHVGEFRDISALLLSRDVTFCTISH